MRSLASAMLRQQLASAVTTTGPRNLEAMSVVVEVLDVDITSLEVEAIANAANTELRHGGGVAGAIARAGGEALVSESAAAAPIGLGEAVETSGGAMPCRWVIHAATMELGGPTSAQIIRAATESTLAVAQRLGARSLALVAFGTGVGGFPLPEAARIEAEAVSAYLLSEAPCLERIVFAVRGESAVRAFSAAWDSAVRDSASQNSAPLDGSATDSHF